MRELFNGIFYIFFLIILSTLEMIWYFILFSAEVLRMILAFVLLVWRCILRVVYGIYKDRELAGGG